MKSTTIVMLIIAALILLPALMNPVASVFAIALIILMFVGRWAAYQVLDIHKHSVMGRESPMQAHQLVRDADDVGNGRGNDDSDDDGGFL